MQRRAASPMITAVKPQHTAINAIANVDSLFVSMPLGSWPLRLPGTLEGFETSCVLVTDTVGIAGECVIIIVVATELVEYSTLGEDSRLVDPVDTEECKVV